MACRKKKKKKKDFAIGGRHSTVMNKVVQMAILNWIGTPMVGS
jgi:ribosome assembly protein YihI (activator of Der GTPase)